MSMPQNDRSPSPWTGLAQDQRDAAYNNNAAVADSAALIAARNRAAIAYRESGAGRLDVPYGTKPRMRLDIFPASDKEAPCLVFIHGGYWQRNAKDDFTHYVTGALKLGWSAAIPGYSLAPDAHLRDIVAEIGILLDWIATHGRDHGLNPRVILSGWSAGAQLAACWLDHPSVVAGVLLSGVYNLAPLRDTYLNTALQLDDDEIAAFSPLHRTAPKVPTLIAYGSDELPALVRDSRALHHAWTDSGSSRLLALPANHFTILDGLLDAASPLLAEVKRTLARSADAT